MRYLHGKDGFAFGQHCDTVINGGEEGAIDAEEEDVKPATETEGYPMVRIYPVPKSNWIVFLCGLVDRKAEVDNKGPECDYGQCAKQIVE